MKLGRTGAISGGAVADVGARVTGAGQLIPTGVQTAVSFATVDYDTAALFTLITPTRFTVPSAGKYEFRSVVEHGVSAVGHRELTFRKNGVSLFIATTARPATGGFNTKQEIVSEQIMAAGDYMEIMCFQDTPGFLVTNFQTFEVRKNA